MHPPCTLFLYPLLPFPFLLSPLPSLLPLHPPFTLYIPCTLAPLCNPLALSLHPPCTLLALSLHPFPALSLHPSCTSISPLLYPLYDLPTPSFHPLCSLPCTLSAPSCTLPVPPPSLASHIVHYHMYKGAEE
jgi:hypothetical protein